MPSSRRSRLEASTLRRHTLDALKFAMGSGVIFGIINGLILSPVWGLLIGCFTAFGGFVSRLVVLRFALNNRLNGPVIAVLVSLPILILVLVGVLNS
jgi:hypothetical protein